MAEVEKLVSEPLSLYLPVPPTKKKKVVKKEFDKSFVDDPIILFITF